MTDLENMIHQRLIFAQDKGYTLPELANLFFDAGLTQDCRDIQAALDKLEKDSLIFPIGRCEHPRYKLISYGENNDC